MNQNERTEELLIKLAEGSLTEAETSELQELLRASPESLDLYLDHCEMETWLAAAGESLSDSGAATVAMAAPAPEEEPAAGRSRGGVAWVAAGFALLATAGFFLFPASEPVETPDGTSGETLAGIAVAEERPDQPESGAHEDDRAEPEGATLASREEVPEPSGRDPWKVINATGSAKHPGLTDTAVPATKATSVRPVKFNRDIRPILSETCFHCHGPDEHGRRADLRLDNLEGAVADLGGYQAIAPGDLENSEAWWRIVSDDPDDLMPPPESHFVLSGEQKQMIKRWIEEGAEYEGHWAYQKPVKPRLPTPAGDWGRGAIDAFILARLEEEGEKPSPEADPRTLIRRLTFDLTGLPPTTEEIRAFLADYQERGEAAWQDAVTRLLDSPHFGERMAVSWMDQARYADTNGYSIDGGRHMWLWRDWVIQAYNRNMPFDRFAVEQLAGDLLPDAGESQRIATGFNRNHMITHEGGTIPEENLTNYAADRVQTTSEVFLGLTMACAQCHDHKFDPISQKEYYQFFSFFNELGDRGLDGNGGINAGPSMMGHSVIPDDELARVKAELVQLRAELEAGDEGFSKWVAAMAGQEKRRGENFELHPIEMLDVSSPNRPGPYEVQTDGSVFVSEPGKGMNAFSHAVRLPKGENVNGIRIRFSPEKLGEGKSLTPFPSGTPKVTTVLVSSGDQAAKQVDIYRQLEFSRATASSFSEGNDPAGVLDERNRDWWEPAAAEGAEHLTITFAEPVDPSETPYLSVMIFFGKPESLPYRWRIDAFTGVDTESVFPEPVSEAIRKRETEWSKGERELVREAFRKHSPGLEPLRVRVANLEERIDVLTKPHSTMVMDTAEKPRETHILERGQYDAPLEKVSSNTPKVLPPLATGSTATRLDLANWMVQPDHPLTARVAVNRIWALFFGNGIVATSADFGSQGEWPSHPALLDWLATEFIAGGWDQKELVRQIVGSAAYRQDSAATAEQRENDPKNRLVGRGPRFRLSAEFIRDQVLAVSGLLVPRIGGPSVQPYQPAGLWKEVSHFGSSPATKQVFVQDKGEKLYRRSLYTFVKRTSPHPAMTAFDAVNREMCIMQRGVTNTPLQALVTLNDPQFTEAARVFAAKLLRETPEADDRERLRLAFETVTSRLPSAGELNAIASFLDDERKRYQADRAAAAKVVSVGDAPLDDDLDVSTHAVWTQVSTMLLNLSETLTRS
ncbi:MAG: PSD1 and planctomycete cytochrome C domain-containing protein [Verrucomicrobiales bacterium]